MRLSRNVTLAIQFLLDECLPPILRDARWFMWPPFRILLGKKAEIVFNFKENALMMDAAEFRAVYESIEPIQMDRETDLNTRCLERIIGDVTGKTVLEVGCGRGLLTTRLAEHGFNVTGVDMRIPEIVRPRSHGVAFLEGDIESLPFTDDTFDTVVCTHTLEHTQNFSVAVSELRRVTKGRLIIVVPKQRNYRYTFDLHLHFFPYPHDLMRAMGKAGNSQTCDVEGGDLYYSEIFVARP